jgi:hypothetical protein
LVAATFAVRHGTSKGSVDRDDFCIRVEFLDRGPKGMNRSATKTTQTIGIFQGMKDLVGPDKVFEFGPGFATQTLLEPPFPSLTDFHFGAVGHVRFEGLRATIHLVRLHDDWLGDVGKVRCISSDLVDPMSIACCCGPFQKQIY